MRFFTLIWEKLTHTRALEMSGGPIESVFFESLRRVTYIAGLSIYDRGWMYLLYSYTVQISILLFVMSELWYLFSETSNLDKVIDNINVTLIHIIAMYRYRHMMSHQDIFLRLASSMEANFDISTKNRKEIMKFWVLRNERYLKLLLALGTCTLLAWYLYPLIDDLEYNLTVAVRLPFDYRSPILYPITYIITLLAFNYTSYFVMVNDLIMQVHLMHLLCQYTILYDCFINIMKDCSENSKPRKAVEQTAISQYDDKWKVEYLDRLRSLVNLHKFVMSNTIELKNTLSTPMLWQFLASSLLICFAGYQVTATIRVSISKFLMSLLYLGYNMFELYIFCRWCEEIKVQSESIAEAAYCSGWENGAIALPGVRLRLLIVIARSRKPVILTAGGIYDLSLASYGTLVKTSYSALTVLLRVRDD